MCFRFPQGPRSGRRVTRSDTADIFEALVRNCQLLLEDGGRRLAPQAGLQCQGTHRRGREIQRFDTGSPCRNRRLQRSPCGL